MYKCQRCRMTFREDRPDDPRGFRTVCAEDGCQMCFISCENVHRGIGVYTTPNRPIPLHVTKVDAA